MCGGKGGAFPYERNEIARIRPPFPATQSRWVFGGETLPLFNEHFRPIFNLFLLFHCKYMNDFFIKVRKFECSTPS